MKARSRRNVSILVALTLLAAACSNSFEESLSDATSTTVTSTTVVAGETTTTQANTGLANSPGFDPTPLPVDPDLRIGTLENGLTYYLRTNQSPGGSVSLRLVVNAGSAQQETPDAGTAHFLEHMLFNGTVDFPGNELTRALESLGIQFGADTNAYTSYDETVYMLSAESGNREAVSTAFDVLAQWAHSATINPSDVVDERGVVRDEMRQSNESSDGMIFAEFEDMYTEGSSYSGYATIGAPDPVESMTAPPLAAFYERWYRPDNMAVVVVGDMSLDEMEEAITSRFADFGDDLPGSVERRDFEITIHPDPRGRVITNPGNVANNISIDLQLEPIDLSTHGGERLSLIEALITAMIGTRMAEGFQNGSLRTSTTPNIGPFMINRGLRYFGTNLQADDLESGLADLFAIWKSAAENGFTETEFNRAVDGLNAALDQMEGQAGSRQDHQFAATYVAHFLDGADIDSPQAHIRRLRETTRGITADEAWDLWRRVLQTSGPIIAAVGADPADLPTAERLVEIAENATSEGLSFTDEPDITTLMSQPAPAAIAETSSETTVDGEVIEWVFENGARVVFQETSIQEGTVSISTASEGGWSLLPEGSSAITQTVSDAVALSGLADFSRTQLERYLSGVSAWIGTYIDTTTEGLYGSSTTEDLEILFQLLNLSVTSARIDEPGFLEAKTFAENSITASTLDPEFEAAIAMSRARNNDSPYWRVVPTTPQLESLTSEEALDLYRSRLSRIDQTVIAIVGDADPDVVKDLASRYIGSLEAGPHDTWINLLPPMPEGVTSINIELEDGVNTGGIDMLWSTEVDVTAKTDVTGHVLETILSSRIIDTIREEIGASYGGSAKVMPVYAPVERVDASLNIDGDPLRIDEIRTVVLAQIDDLAANGPTREEFERAISVISSDYRFVDNSLFITTILTSRLFPNETILDADNRLDQLSKVTRRDVRNLARLVLPPDRLIEVTRTSP